MKSKDKNMHTFSFSDRKLATITAALVLYLNTIRETDGNLPMDIVSISCDENRFEPLWEYEIEELISILTQY